MENCLRKYPKFLLKLPNKLGNLHKHTKKSNVGHRVSIYISTYVQNTLLFQQCLFINMKTDYSWVKTRLHIENLLPRLPGFFCFVF